MKDTKTYQTRFSLCSLGHAPGVGLWGTGGAQVVKKNSNMVMWHIKLTRMTSRTECKLNFHPRVKLVTLGCGQRSNIIKFRLPCQFQRFLYQTLCVFSVFSQIKDRNILNRIFILLPGSCPGVRLVGAGGVKNFSVGICDGAPSTTCSSLIFVGHGHLKKLGLKSLLWLLFIGRQG